MSIYYIIKSSLVTPLPYLQTENNETIELGNKRTTEKKRQYFYPFESILN